MGFISWATLLTCLFVGATLFFSVNANALRVFSRLRLQEAFKRANGEERPELVEKVAQNADRLILACAFYRLLFNMGALLLMVALMEALYKELTLAVYAVAFVVSLAIFSVFSLAIPYAWAKYAGEKLISRTYWILLVCAAVATPILYILQLYDGFVRRLAGVPEATPEDQQNQMQEEFLEDLEQRRMEGAVDEEEQEMIENVLEFRERTAAEIMTPRTDLIAVDVHADLATVLDRIRQAGHSRIPVYEGTIDNVVGLIYAKDLLSEIGKPPEQFSPRARMREAYFVPETKPLRALLHEFQEQKLHMAVVLDEYGGTAGIVTLEDIIEELVGDIADEYDEARQESVKKIDENTIEVDARTYVEDLNDRYELDLPEDEDYDTVGGFVFSRLGYVPKAGEDFEYEKLRFTIASAEPRRVKRVRIQRLTEQ
ncbi:MAG TPA: hemolysin family protein [Sedimentisphaerales bacterium]|nr:hemolysin family protein [Sedimentisphaerales bacterium]HNU28417.1 hemolysin family protein [Sedimentisphaerales bacterium]